MTLFKTNAAVFHVPGPLAKPTFSRSRVRLLSALAALTLVSGAPLSSFLGSLSPTTTLVAAEQGLATAPSFTAKDLTGKSVSLGDFKGKIVVLEWFNRDCPFVKKHYNTNNMQNLQKKYIGQGVVWLTINSSAKGKQGNMSPEEHSATLAEWKSSPSHFLIDEDGKVGTTFGAKTTPHLYIVDKEGEIAYQGAIDTIRSTEEADVPKATNLLSAALDEVLAGKPVKKPETVPYGCAVKY